ncbi:MAG: acyl carrier protein [Pontixanthobacter sp.]
MTNENIEREIAQFFIEREGEGVMDSIREMDLIDAGILDSLDLVSLATMIDTRFGVKLDVGDPATFASMRRYDDLVKLAQTGTPAPVR